MINNTLKGVIYILPLAILLLWVIMGIAGALNAFLFIVLSIIVGIVMLLFIHGIDLLIMRRK